jgi:hypothetical protein
MISHDGDLKVPLLTESANRLQGVLEFRQFVLLKTLLTILQNLNSVFARSYLCRMKRSKAVS